MKVAILQINAFLAQPEVNGKIIESAYSEAIRRGADLVVAPELCVPGYIPGDKLFETRLRHDIDKENHRLLALSGNVPLVFGTCSPVDSGKLWNELWWCEKGKLVAKARKGALSDFGALCESRYFEPCVCPQKPVEYMGNRIGLSVGETLHGSFEALVRDGATLIINAVASTCALGSYVPKGRRPSWALPSKTEQRRTFLSGQSKTFAAPILYVNRVGAEECLLFDGEACLALPDGTCQRGERFASSIFIVDTDMQGTAWPDELDGEGVWLRQALTLGMKDNLFKQGIEAAIIGLSGGIDSAVVAALAAGAISPEKILGVSLPSRYTSSESIELAKTQAQKLGINYMALDADAPYAGAVSSLQTILPGRQFGLTDENLQCRSRGTLLMALSSEPEIHRLLSTSRCAVLNTGNKSEVATGYFTMYGDGIGAFGIIGDLLKARVYGLAKELGDLIPLQVINRPPTAELKPNQTDESSLMPYKLLDAVLGTFIEANRPAECIHDDLSEVLEGQDLLEARNVLPRILELIDNNEFKRRQLPFALKVTHRAFGAGKIFL
jgi:NAD+ synthase (glutamine-hydrolysing)